MFDYTKVEAAVQRVVRQSDPKLVIVFGSVARYEAEDDSDLDILVVFDEPVNHKQMY